MIGVTEEKAKAMFLELWPDDRYEWDFESAHFQDLCNRFGLDIVNDAKYELMKARESGRVIRDEMQYLWGCARAIKEREGRREASIGRKPQADDDGITPSGFDSYTEYFNHLIDHVQQDFPDTPEVATQRQEEVRARIERRRQVVSDNLVESKVETKVIDAPKVEDLPF